MDPTTQIRAEIVGAAGLFGLVIGSFLNAVVYRLPRGISLSHSPSSCPHCHTPLRPTDNIPVVSWLVLRGACRTCHSPISPRYPIIEALTAVAFCSLAWAVGSFDPLPSLLVVAAAAVAAATIDLDRADIPWAVTGAGALGALSLIAVALVVHQPGRIGWAAVGGLASAAGSLLLDRSDSGRRRAAAVTALGWSCGWVWPPGGLALAGWSVCVTAVVALWSRGRQEAPEGSSLPEAAPAGALAIASLAGLALLIAGSVVRTTA